LQELEAQYDQRLAAGNRAAANAIHDQLTALSAKRDDLDRRERNLTVLAPFAGRWSTPQLDGRAGVYARHGDPLGRLVSDDALRVVILADQNVGPRLRNEMALGDTVRVRLRDEPDKEVAGRVTRFVESGRRRLPSEALGLSGGGEIMTDPDDPNTQRTARAYFEVHLDVDQRVALDAGFRPGQAVVARFSLPDRPIAAQAYRTVRQLLQNR
jgi:putative peptide zinc metalloprotease protein